MTLLKNTIGLDIVSPNYEFSCELHRRITVVHGESGVGKSTLVEQIEVSSNSPDIRVKCELHVFVSNSQSWQSALQGARDSVIIFDDERCTEDKEFAKACKENLVKNNLYLILIDRSEKVQDLEGLVSGIKTKYGMFSIATREVYNFKSEGIHHWLDHDEVETWENLRCTDLVLVEDAGRGYEFFDKHFDNVRAASNGKSSIITDLLCYNFKKALVLLDTAAYGVHVEEFKRRIVDNDIPARFCPKYECFEYLILRSNFLRDAEVTEEVLASVGGRNDYISWENWYEAVVKELTKSKLYTCTHTRHSILSDCYFVSCVECNEAKREKCDVKNKDVRDKIEQLFKGTEFECLLELPRKELHEDCEVNELKRKGAEVLRVFDD